MVSNNPLFYISFYGILEPEVTLSICDVMDMLVSDLFDLLIRDRL